MPTDIEWARNADGTKGETWNPTTGCDRVSDGCDNCYAMTLAKRLKAIGQPHYQNDGDPRTSGPGFALTVHPDSLDKPLHWRKPRTVFVNSMSDLFHPSVSDDFIARVFAAMLMAERHTFQVLTKRPQRMRALLDCLGDSGGFWSDVLMEAVPPDENGEIDSWWHRNMVLPGPCRNVWLGTSIESDKYAFRADHLRATPAAVRFLSLEPLLGPLPSLDLTGIDWVIVGGESGPGARPMHPDWARDIRDRCVAAGVPFFFKQWGAWGPTLPEPGSGRTTDWVTLKDEGGRHLARVGKKAAGRELDGREWSEMPQRAVARFVSQRVTFGVPEYQP